MTLSATLVPHVTHFDRADITELDAIIRRNVEPARQRGLTLTLTSFLLKAAALALLEHPQFNASLDPAAGELVLKRYYHLGVAGAREEPVVLEGRIVPRVLLPLSLTFDHRVADGADGARFATAIVRRLERPEQLLLEW